MAIDAGVIESLKLAGAPDDVIERAEAEAEQAKAEPDFEVHPDNWPAFMFFCGLQTQWDILMTPAGRMRRMCLKWPSVEIALNYAAATGEIKTKADRAALFDDVKTMELEALKVFREREQEDE